MALRRRVVGVEYAAGRLVAVEASRRGVARALVLALPEGQPDPVSLTPMLERAGIRSGHLHVVAWDSEQAHQLLTLPPMSAGERTLYVRRELARDGGAPRAIGAEVVRRVADGVSKDEVLAVAAPSETIERLAVAFRSGRLAPRLVTTGPLALVAAVRRLTQEMAEEPTVVAHLGFSGLTVAVVAAGRLTLARQIPRLAAPGLDPLEWTGTEIQRSIRHYAMTSKGQTAVRVLFATRVAAMERLFCASGQLETRLGLPVVNLNEVLRALLPDGVEEETGVAAGGFLLAFGAAVLPPRRALNLLPAEMLAEQRSRRLTRRALVAGLALAIGLGAGYWWTAREVGRLRADLQRVGLARQVSEVRAREVATIQGERQQAAQRVRLLLEDPLGRQPIADALREVSRLAPEGLRLERLALSRDERGYSTSLGGTVTETDLAEAQREFNQLYFGLRASPLFYDVTFTKRPGGGGPATPTVQTPPASPAASRAPSTQFGFDMTLRLKEVR